MFMGSNTIKNIISKLDEDIEFINKERLSNYHLRWTQKNFKIERKTAVIAFSLKKFMQLQS